MATTITQDPLVNTFPVGQDVIFSLSNTTVVNDATLSQVKFVAEVHISSGTPPNTATTTDVVGTFKTSPNNAGIGMFDLSSIMENFVSADNTASEYSSYKSDTITTEANIPMHLIDKYSRNQNTIRYMQVKFYVEYINASNQLISGYEVISSLYKFFNGYLKESDTLTIQSGSYGYNIDRFLLVDQNGRFLSNAPIHQNANLEDYGTLPFLNVSSILGYMYLVYQDSNSNYLDFDEIPITLANGAYDAASTEIDTNVIYFGCFPGNLQNHSTKFKALVTAGTIQGGVIIATLWSDTTGNEATSQYRINVNCPTLKGYEPIRLTWLNQWGTWDYYTFNMKSTKSIATKGTTYEQISGTWNESLYQINGFKGGKKAFRVNATEKITMNTDFVSEADSEWFEELINSPEVYEIKGYQDDEIFSSLNQYVTPVRLTTSSFTRKTVANDKLMQYTFEVEKSKTLRTQAV
tara:strand:+ start:534 stop:1925 length:1392 start_codon:yes stop_codon:yes gene_type:complete